MNENFDAARLTLLLSELRLPATKQIWARFAEQSDKEGWPAARLLTVIAENELAERDRRRIERHLAEAKLLPGKTLDSFDFAVVPTIAQARVRALAEGDGWLQSGHNLLAFGPPGAGKTHLGSAIGHELVQRGYRVLMARTSDLVQRLQTARQDLALSQEIAKLDKFDLLILDDIYRLVHHATIFEMNVESYRRRTALASATALRDKGDVADDTDPQEKEPATPSSDIDT